MPTASVYCKALASVAIDQHQKFHLMNEGDPELTAQIRRYWTEIGFEFPGVATAWSAVFVSWCVKQAGADKSEFLFAEAHSEFVFWAIQNAVDETGLFQGFDIDEYAPKVGDIIQNNRNHHQFDFEFAKTNKNYESHSTIVVETGEDENGRYALTIGGNESDSVRQRVVRLRDDGRIRQLDINPFISVICDLK